MNHEVFHTGWWQEALKVQATGPGTTNLYSSSYPSLRYFSHTYALTNIQLILWEVPCADFGMSISTSLLWSINHCGHLDLYECSAHSSQIRKSIELCLYSSSCARAWKFSEGKEVGPFIGVILLASHLSQSLSCCLLSAVLKSVVNMFWVFLFLCFR